MSEDKISYYGRTGGSAAPAATRREPVRPLTPAEEALIAVLVKIERRLLAKRSRRARKS